MSDEIKLATLYTVVHLGWEGDGIMALYMQDNLHTEGDEYHNDISTWIEGFFAGLDEAGVSYSRQDLYVSDEHWDGDSAPSGLDELRDMYPVQTEDEIE